MPLHWVNPAERDYHLKAMHAIATELRTDFNIVRQAYEHELSRLQAGAKLHDYIPLLAARHTRELLHDDR